MSETAALAKTRFSARAASGDTGTRVAFVGARRLR